MKNQPIFEDGRIQITANGTDNVHTQSPYWLMLVLPYELEDVFDFTKMLNNDVNVSVTDDVSEAIKTNAPILIDAAVSNWTVSSTKASHVSTLGVELHPEENYLQEITPGNWCFFWVFDNRVDYADIRTRIITHYAPAGFENQRSNPTGVPVTLNDFMSGLKFVGKVASIRKFESRNAAGGFSVGYTLQAHGYTELDSYIYVNDEVAKRYQNVVQVYEALAIMQRNMNIGETTNFVNAQEILPILVKIFVGAGPPQSFTEGPAAVKEDPFSSESILKSYNAALKQAQMGPPEQQPPRSSANTIFAIPKVIAKMFGLSTGSPLLGGLSTESPDVYTYADLIHQYIGVQEYSGLNSVNDFVPKSTEKFNKTFICSRKLNDEFPLTMIDFTNRSVWAALMSFVNVPINEMYTALRPNNQGKLFPSLIVRRYPMATQECADNLTDYDVTPFQTLPCWEIDKSRVVGSDLGRTDSARINYVWVAGVNSVSGSPVTSRQQDIIQVPPANLTADIVRNGLRLYNTNVASFTNNLGETAESNPGRKYTAFMSSFNMDGALKYNGSLSVSGIIEPIAEGDNLLYDGILYHIERVQHSGGISPMGAKRFVTNIDLSNGIPFDLVEEQHETVADARNSREDIEHIGTAKITVIENE